MKREQFLEAFYRIWGVGTGPYERLALLDKVKGSLGGTDLSDTDLDYQLMIVEEFHFPHSDDEDASWFPEERDIYISKYCWEKGIDIRPEYQLRYFETHYPEVADDAPQDFDQRLVWFHNRFILLP